MCAQATQQQAVAVADLNQIADQILELETELATMFTSGRPVPKVGTHGGCT